MTTPSYDRAGAARRALQEIYRDYGLQGIDNDALLNQLLPDLLAGSPKEAGLLKAAASAKTGAQLLNRIKGGLDPAVAVRDMAAIIGDLSALDPNACMWVVSEYAAALGHPVDPVMLDTAEPPQAPPPQAPPPQAPPPQAPPPQAPPPQLQPPQAPPPQARPPQAPPPQAPLPQAPPPQAAPPQGPPVRQVPPPPQVPPTLQAPPMPPAQAFPAAQQFPPAQQFSPGRAALPPVHQVPTTMPMTQVPPPHYAAMPPVPPAMYPPGPIFMPQPAPKPSRLPVLLAVAGGVMLILIASVVAVIMLTKKDETCAGPPCLAEVAPSVDTKTAASSPSIRETSIVDLLPADLSPTRDCASFGDSTPNGFVGIREQLNCTEGPMSTISGAKVNVYRFDSRSSVRASLEAFNEDRKFKATDDECPPTGTHTGGKSEWSRTQDKSVSGTLECYVSVGEKNFYIWTDEKNFVLYEVSTDKSFETLNTWWTHLRRKIDG